MAGPAGLKQAEKLELNVAEMLKMNGNLARTPIEAYQSTVLKGMADISKALAILLRQVK